MGRFKWYAILAMSLLAVSALSYTAQYLIFRKPEDTFFYMLQDFAFVPIQVLIVTMILDRLLKGREKRALINKLNMVIGVFFHELGNQLLALLLELMRNRDTLQQGLAITPSWTTKQFKSAKSRFAAFNYNIDIDPVRLENLKRFLTEKRNIILNLLENPNLLEHDTFTDMLWAVFHVCDELYHRTSFDALPESDLAHLRGDINRACALLVPQWISYGAHLRTDYPYLYSIALRTNPFNPSSDHLVR